MTDKLEKVEKKDKKEVTERKDRKEVKERKENFFQKWWRETLGELRKVTWPTREDAYRLTKIVLIVVVAMSVLLGVMDFIFSRVIGLLLA